MESRITRLDALTEDILVLNIKITPEERRAMVDQAAADILNFYGAKARTGSEMMH